jgi:hypothetical protein
VQLAGLSGQIKGEALSAKSVGFRRKALTLPQKTGFFSTFWHVPKPLDRPTSVR